MKLIFTGSPLITQYEGVKAKTGLLGIVMSTRELLFQ